MSIIKCLLLNQILDYKDSSTLNYKIYNINLISLNFQCDFSLLIDKSEFILFILITNIYNILYILYTVILTAEMEIFFQTEVRPDQK